MSAETFLDGRVMLHVGDCLDVFRALPENSVDAVVTDPPYHLHSITKRFAKTGRTESSVSKSGPHNRTARGFMGKAWDGGDIAFRVDTWAEVLRVLKPGGYILAFASTRGFGRMSVAIEDAGFITHPLIAWVFGSGFPKATRIQAEGFEGQRYGGQALKPAVEPIYMGQKPFSEPTGTANILRWGTGAVEIDGYRVEGGKATGSGSLSSWRALEGREGEASADRRYQDEGGTNFAMKPGPRGGDPSGRWPANLIHDGSEEVLAAFPEAPGQQREVNDSFDPKVGTAVYGDYGPRPTVMPRDSGGSAARFFYTAKADADDRIGSKHPTVKPVDLMQYLVRLVTPKGGLVLDPFGGTGTTGEAAWREACRAILIEREEEYAADIRRRMELALAGPDERRRRRAAMKPQEEAFGLFGGAA